MNTHLEPLVADKPYKIYEYIVTHPTSLINEYEAPWSIDFITDLNIRLHPKRTFVKGELREVIYYADFTNNVFSIPVVRETFTYSRDTSTLLADFRNQTIEWYLDDETIGPHPKIRGPKYYHTIGEKREEVYRKRKNQINRASEIVIGFLVTQGNTVEQAAAEGQLYWRTLQDEIVAYENGNQDGLITRISNDATPTWVPLVKSLLLDELQ